MELTTSLLIESWILYAVGVLMVACRMASRRIKLGKWINLMMDDYLMLFALVRSSETLDASPRDDDTDCSHVLIAGQFYWRCRVYQ